MAARQRPAPAAASHGLQLRRAPGRGRRADLALLRQHLQRSCGEPDFFRDELVSGSLALELADGSTRVLGSMDAGLARAFHDTTLDATARLLRKPARKGEHREYT